MSQPIAAYFLSRVWDLKRCKKFERHWLRGPEGDYGFKVDEDLGTIAEEVAARPGDWFFAPHVYLPHRGRCSENIVQLNAIVVDLDHGDLEEALVKLQERGLKPHYVIGTSPGRWQLVLLQEPIRLGRRNRAAVLKRQERVICELYELVGGDMAAAKVNQLYRLPGSRRQLEDGVWDVRVWAESQHQRYTLARLERAIRGKGRARRSTFRGYRPIKDWPKGNGSRVRVLGCPAIRWLREHVIAEGHRNAALVALCYAAAMDGLSEEEARPMLLDWIATNTAGPYPKHSNGKPEDKPEAVIRSCFANPKGLDWKKLAPVADVNGEVMGEERAKTVYKAMPRVRQRHQRLPIDQLKNRPLFESLGKVLEVLFELQLRNRRLPVALTNEELAERSGVPLGTVKRLKKILHAWGVTEVVRRGRSYLTTYDLRKIPLSAYNLYAFIRSNPALEGLFRRPLWKVFSYWAWRFKELWKAFLKLLKVIAKAFAGGVRHGAEAGREVVEHGTRAARRSRGPPWRASSS